jgi:hypothetical protein
LVVEAALRYKIAHDRHTPESKCPR